MLTLLNYCTPTLLNYGIPTLLIYCILILSADQMLVAYVSLSGWQDSNLAGKRGLGCRVSGLGFSSYMSLFQYTCAGKAQQLTFLDFSEFTATWQAG
jgi:hypothetical protein